LKTLGGTDFQTATGSIVWLASYPKSGNTWFRILIANLKSGWSEPVRINALEDSGRNFSSRDLFDEMTLIESGLLRDDEVDSLQPAVCWALSAEAPHNHWVKIHDRWRYLGGGEPLLSRGAGRAAVYIVRDPRDVAVSLAHHNSKPFDSAIDFMNTPCAALGRSGSGQSPRLWQELGDWSTHVRSWLDQTDVPVYGVTYEALRRDTAGVLSGALDFAGESFTNADIERAVRNSDFSELRRQESSQGFRERLSTTTPFFRVGEPGGWRNELTPAQVRRIVDAHGEVMAQLGYL
jgi:aryl sulfotransferase